MAAPPPWMARPSGVNLESSDTTGSEAQLMQNSTGREMACRGLILLAALGLGLRVAALSVTNNPVTDTSLMEVAPDHNNGGQAWVLAGRTQNGPHNHALYRFGFANVPSNAIIQSAVLQLEVTHQPGDASAVDSPFGLHRMLRPWGEGTNVAIANPGQGTPATPGEATWTHSFYPTNAWAAPGGAAGVDYATGESSYQFIYSPDLSPYRFESTPEMVDDVQEWISRPQNNFGWMLIGDDDTIYTARRFNSREDPNAQPLLEVFFILPTQIEQAAKIGNQFNLSFVALPGQSYAVEFRDSFLTGNWQTLANVGYFTETNRVLVVDTATPTQRFYRVATH